MDIKHLLSRIDGIVAEDRNTAQSMDSARRNPSGAKFGGYWKGTDKNPPKPGQGVGGESRDSILKDFERELKENPRPQLKRDLMREFRDFVIEYGGVGGYGAASQAPQGSTAANPDPAAAQQKINQQQIQKSTNLLKSTLNSQGASQPLNPVKFNGVMDKLDTTPNTNLNNQEQNQLGPLAVAASKALKNPQTAGQLKQLITKADQADKQQQAKLAQQQKATGTNTPAAQQQTPGQPAKPNQPGQSQTSAGQTP